MLDLIMPYLTNNCTIICSIKTASPYPGYALQELTGWDLPAELDPTWDYYRSCMHPAKLLGKSSGG